MDIPTFEELEKINVFDINKYLSDKYPHLEPRFYTCVDHQYTIIIIKNKNDYVDLCPCEYCCDDIYFTSLSGDNYLIPELIKYLKNVEIVQIDYLFKYE
jgi:hypothetical protein